LTKKIIARLRYTTAAFSQGLDRLRRELAKTRLGASSPVQLMVRVVRELGEDDATHMAASVSYYAILSLFPLILGLSAIIGLAAESPTRQQELVDFVVSYLPGSEQFVQDNIVAMVRFRGALGVASIFGLLWTASAVFGSITRVVNRAWGIQGNPPFFKNKPRQLVMALSVGALFAFSAAVSSFLQWATSIEIGDRTLANLLGGTAVALLLRLPTYLISFGMFALIYKYIPNTNTRWRDIWLGAVIAAVLFELAKSLFVWYLENFARYDQLYGNVASIIVLMVWIYVSAFIFILGAEFGSEYGRLKSLHEPES